MNTRVAGRGPGQLPAVGDFGRRLRQARRRMGWSLAITAGVLHVSKGTLSKWERGIHAPQSAGTRLRVELWLLHALELPPVPAELLVR